MKEAVPGKIRDGRKVAEEARKHGVNERTVRN